ncbi:MAG: tetratricopeptide repeat protein [Brevundimonas sp.]
MLIATALGGVFSLGGVAIAQDFEAVMAAPDDLALNLAYARTAADAGDLNGAAAALERVLLVDPNRHSARLLYAVVLYRLDDLQGARDQLNLLDPMTLTPLQRAEATRYRQQIERGRSTTRAGGSLSAALVYEEDAAGALAAQFDSLLAPPASEDGTSAVLAGRFSVSHDLSALAEHAVYGSIGGSDKSSVDGVNGDIRQGDVELGLSYLGRLNAWSVGALARAVELFDEPYLVETGVRARASWRLSSATTLSLSGEAMNQSFDEPVVDAAPALLGRDRDGRRYAVGLGLSHRLSQRSTLGASVGWQDKQADYAPFGYSGPVFQARFDTRTRRGQYLALSAGLQSLEYDAPDPVFLGLGSPTRQDVRTWARAAVGAPISAFAPGGATGDWRQDVSLEAALTYGGRESEPPLADYQSWGAELRLAWRFGVAD